MYYVPYIGKYFVFISLYQRVHIVISIVSNTRKRRLAHISRILLQIDANGTVFTEYICSVLEVKSGYVAVLVS